MNRKTEKRLLLFYITAFLVIASTLALFQPLGDTARFVNPPDEHGRVLIPWYICRHGVLPTGFEEEVRVEGYGISYGLYTILPYVVQGYVMRFVSLFTDSPRLLLYAGRFVNVLSGTLMAYVVFLLSRKLFADRRAGWLFCFCVMYLPQSLFIHTYINTDSMCLLSTAIMVYALVSAYREDFTVKNCLWLSGGIILCALSYYNAYGYILSSIFLFLAYFCRLPREKGEDRAGYDWRQMLSKGILISVVVLLGIGWQFIRNYVLYDGDILGLATLDKMKIQFAVPEANPLTRSTYLNRGESVWDMLFGSDFIKMTFKSFVGVFGSLSIWGNNLMYLIFLLFFGVGGLSCVLLRTSGKDFLDGLPGWKKWFFHINMFFCISMPVFLLLYYSYAVDFQRQGRYAMPMIVPLMYYVVRGYEKLFTVSKLSRRTQNGIIGMIILLLVSSTLYMTYTQSLPLYVESGLMLDGIMDQAPVQIDFTPVESESLFQGSNDLSPGDSDLTQASSVSPEEPEITLVMVGDMLMHTPVTDSGLQEDGSYEYGHLFTYTQDVIEEADLALVNQEVILGGTQLGLSGYPSFNAPYELGDALVDAGFDVVLHATNHTLDKGVKGVENCLDFWEQEHSEIAVLGIQRSAEERDEIYIYEQDGIRIAILNYTYGTNGIAVPQDMPWLIDMLYEERIAQDIAKAKEEADFVIVCPHWGTEYVHEASKSQKRWAQFFMECGADLCIGTHPHVIEPVEWLEGENGERMLVYYSLGNYVNCTSSYGEGVADRMLGALARVTVARDDEGDVYIKEYGAEPLVTYVSADEREISVYPMELFTEEMAASSITYQKDSNFSLEYCERLWEEVFGDLE